MQSIFCHIRLAWLLVAVMHLFVTFSHGRGVEKTVCDDGDTCESTHLVKKLYQSRTTVEVMKDNLDGTKDIGRKPKDSNGNKVDGGRKRKRRNSGKRGRKVKRRNRKNNRRSGRMKRNGGRFRHIFGGRKHRR
mmetsp:Transcript_70384/g.139616  ORF Transcript_70384/g.139616 Transcript_70384/m.139616 type:complete len:133 (-) Transcript_70384:115-513(-)